MRLPITLLLLGTLAGCGTDPTGVSQILTVRPLDNQTGWSAQVATLLAQPLRVEVQADGVPKAGIMVEWTSESGQFSPAPSVTDAEGIATTRWMLGTKAGAWTAVASVVGGVTEAEFSATAVPGEAVLLRRVAAASQLINMTYSGTTRDLGVRLEDQFGNAIVTPPIAWSVLSGAVEFVGPPFVDAIGNQWIRVRGSLQEAGLAQVEARATGTALSADFGVELLLSDWLVSIANARGYLSVDLVSRQNSTLPAVDTMPVGSTMIFLNEDDDVLNYRRIVSVGLPAFPGCPNLPNYGDRCRVTLTAPGTYRYTLADSDVLAGTIVVR